MTKLINTPSFRRDMKHLAELMDMTNAMYDFNGIPVLTEAVAQIDVIIETLNCYANEVQAARASVKLKQDQLLIANVISKQSK